MKTKIFLLLITLTSSHAFSQSKTVALTMKVFGNCTMCKHRIETSLDRKGIKKAQWDPKTKELQIVYNSDKITEQQIHEIIASVGHDTEKIKAKDEVYSTLPFCCLYRDHDHAVKEQP